MTATTKRNDKKAGSEKVVIEVEQTDDGLQFSLKGLEALRGLKETLSPLCCCVPIAVACKGSEKPHSGKQPGD
jgi:hypothetical protein